MADSSTPTTLLKLVRAFGSERVTGESNVTGKYICIQAVSETTLLGDTDGNMENINGLTLTAGTSILGEWDVVHTTGECIIYKQ